MAKFLQWNVRGLQANREDLSLLLSSLKPTIFALQERNIGKNHNINFQSYSLYNCSGTENNGIYHGGSALIVDKTTPHSLIALRTNLQATAVRVTVFRTITVCSVYLPPSQKLDIKDLEDLYRQFPTPALLLGDFNAHSQTWGFRNTNSQGRCIEDFMPKQNVYILNTGNHTYFHPGTGSLSAIDLSLCHPSLYLDLSWSVHEDLCGSDHYPVVITATQSYDCDTDALPSAAA